MTDAYTIQPEFTRSRSGRNRAVSRQNSPIPRQQLGVLNVNQRSYSRAGRKSAGEDGYGDDSFQLMSPLPFYPHRRSVTFADGSETEKSGVREERPHYNTTLTASASQPSMSAGVSPTRRGESPVASPPPTSILKNSSAYSEDDVASPHVRPPSGQAAAMSPRGSPVPLRRGRSASRQRLRARRHEAQLHHSFYEDSFVEEFVLGAKEDWERQQTEQRQAEKEKQQKKQESAATEEKEEHLTALQQAKEILLAAFQKRHRLGSPTPSPSRATTIHDGTEQQIATELPPRESVHSEKTKRTEANLLESLEEDSNPEVQEALAELSRLSAAAVASQTRSTAAARKRRCSMPIVAPEEEDDVEGSEPARQRSRVERLVAQLLERHERQPSKRSVVVINWEKEEEEARPSDELVEFTVRGAAQGGKRRAVTAATSSAPRRRTVSRAASAVPDLGDDSLLMRVVGEDDAAPILLPRRRPTRPAPTRSLSHLERDVDDVLFHESAEEEVVDVSRRPPRRAPAPRRRAAPKNSARVAKATPASRSRVEEENDMDDYDNYGEDESLNISSIPQTTTLNSTSSRNYATVSHTNSAPAPRRRRHVDVNASPVDRSDPMAVFFDAAFPSPSKFDDMLLQSGGMPEARRGHGRNQPNLVLPATIGRRRV